MQFKYKARTSEGEVQEGIIDAASVDLAVSSLQRKNLLLTAIQPTDTENVSVFSSLENLLGIFDRVKMQDVVVLSRQLATLFESKVPVVSAFNVLLGEIQSKILKKHLAEMLDDIQGGMPMSQAMARHPDVFSKFYVSMVRSGEESGKLEEIFKFLADYLERSYELSRKAKNALIYPAFVLSSFVVVMVLMLVVVIPKISAIITETGQAVPIYTQVVIGLSNLLRNFGVVILVFLAVIGVLVARYARTENGKLYFARLLISVPIIGGLYRKIYLSRIADNLHTLLSGGISVVRALEITADVVDNDIYKNVLLDSIESVKGGSMISDSFSKYKDIPSLFSQMIRIGEETGKLDYILKNIAGFYRRDVDNLIDNLVSLIEPVLILALGLGVGLLVAAVLIPIYNISSTF